MLVGGREPEVNRDASSTTKGGTHDMPKPAFLLFLGLAMVACADMREQVTVPMGLLGHRIGTYLEIEGTRLERGKVGHQTLLVDRVGNSRLDRPVGIWIENLPLPTGVRCVVRGYETGRWIGLPPEVERAESMPPRQAGWQFQRFFVPTSVLAPPSLVEQFRAAGGAR